MKKHCIDCGIIFYTDDRRDEEEADSDYLKNCYRISRYSRRYENTQLGIIKILFFVLLRSLYWMNEHLIKGSE